MTRRELIRATVAAIAAAAVPAIAEPAAAKPFGIRLVHCKYLPYMLAWHVRYEPLEQPAGAIVACEFLLGEELMQDTERVRRAYIEPAFQELRRMVENCR